MPSAVRSTRSKEPSSGPVAAARQGCSSVLRGWSRRAARSRFSAAATVRLSLYESGPCLLLHSIPSFRMTCACIGCSRRCWKSRERGHRVSGHSKWATTKHKKAVVDARRGKLFAKLIKTVEVAARTGGADPAGNPTFVDAIAKAKWSSVPNDNIDRAVKRGAGLEAGGADYQPITYEGYGPGGVALFIECLSDNRNRAASDVRTAVTRNGGTMADPGSVGYLFTRKGVVLVAKAGGVTEDDVLTAVLEAGAD